VIVVKWVCKAKLNPGGSVNKLKARLVVKRVQSEKVYKFHKALYSLKHAPRTWYNTVDDYLLEQGFTRS